jgi:hypothetical protein
MACNMNVEKSQRNQGADNNKNAEKTDNAQKFGSSMKNQGSANNDQKSGLTAANNSAGNDNAGKTDYKQGADYKALTAENKNVVDKYMDTLNEAASSQGPMNEDQKQGANARGNWASAVAKNAQEAGIIVSDGTTPEEYKAIMDKVQSTPGESQRLSGLQDDYTNKLQNSLNGTDAEDRVRRVADGHFENGYRIVDGELITINEAGDNNKSVPDAAKDWNFMTSTGEFSANAPLSMVA